MNPNTKYQKLQRPIILVMRERLNIPKKRKDHQPLKIRIVWLKKVSKTLNDFEFTEQGHSTQIK